MKLTNSARDAILHVLKSRDMDPANWYMEFKLLDNGAVGLGFTNRTAGEVLTFGELRLTIDGMIDTEGVVLDYGEVGGRQGLLFATEGQVSSAQEPDERHTCSGECGDDCCGGTGIDCCGSGGYPCMTN